MFRFYIYRHIRLDKNQPFYIGIGKRKEFDFSYCRANRLTYRNKIWNDIYSKTDIRIDILLDNLTHEQVNEKEKEFIAMYGRINLRNGILANMTDGGEGTHNFVVSNEFRQKLRDANLGRRMSDETKIKIAKTRIGKVASDESRKRMSIAQKGRIVSHENRLRQSSFIRSEKMQSIIHSESAKIKRIKTLIGGEIVAYKNGVEIGRYISASDAERKLNCTNVRISAVVSGKENSHKGYTFKKVC
jgi:hypothetical protein